MPNHKETPHKCSNAFTTATDKEDMVALRAGRYILYLHCSCIHPSLETRTGATKRGCSQDCDAVELGVCSPPASAVCERYHRNTGFRITWCVCAHLYNNWSNVIVVDLGGSGLRSHC